MIPVLFRPLARRKFLLDLIPTQATAAYSLRKLRKNYTGAAIRVRRSSGNTELDIGFAPNGELDIVALLNFVGVGSGFIVTWYDQSAKVINATQSTTANQPRIVNTGTLDTQNGKPTIVFSGGQFLTTSANFSHAGAFSALAVIRANVVNTGIFQIGNINTQGSLFQEGIWRARPSTTGGATTTYNANEFTQLSAVYQNQNTQIWKQGIDSTADTTNSTVSATNSAITIGALNSTTYLLNGRLSELSLFSGALLTSERQILERSQGSYYGISIS